jgi:hypothetical protein
VKDADTDDKNWLALALAGLLPDEPPAPGRSAALRARIVSAATVGRTRVVRAGEGEWMPLLPGIRVKTLRKDAEGGTQTTLWRIEPGGRIPAHPHAREEECLVLAGTIVHAGVEYHAGDFLLAAAGERHQEFTCPGGALLLIRGECLPDPARLRALQEPRAR